MTRVHLLKITLILTTIFIPLISTAKELSLADMNPVVVSTFPIVGETTVDPATTKIIIKFSQDMMTTNMWSVVKLNNANFPYLNGDVYFEKDMRTFVMPVNLEPQVVYAFSVNSANKRGFTGVSGKAALPYIVSFKTGAKH